MEVVKSNLASMGCQNQTEVIHQETVAEMLRETDGNINVALEQLYSLRGIMYADAITPTPNDEKSTCLRDDVACIRNKTEVLLKQIDVIRSGLCG